MWTNLIANYLYVPKTVRIEQISQVQDNSGLEVRRHQARWVRRVAVLGFVLEGSRSEAGMTPGSKRGHAWTEIA